MKFLKRLSRLFSLYTGLWCDCDSEARNILIGLRVTQKRSLYYLRNGAASQLVKFSEERHEALYNRLLDVMGETSGQKAYSKYVTY